MKKSAFDSISVVVPMYNEAGNVKPLLEEIQSALHKNSEIIVVDDGSKDGTYRKLHKMSSEISQLRILRHKKNYGQSAGLLTGVKAANHEWIVTLDGDGQNDPADIQKLIDAMLITKKGTPLPIFITGIRTQRDDTFIRRLSSRVANGVRSFLLRDDCPDTGCALKLFRREDFMSLPHFNHFHRFLPALFRRAGISIMQVSVGHRPRVHGKSKYGIANRLWVGIIDIFGVVWLIRRSCRPELKDNA